MYNVWSFYVDKPQKITETSIPKTGLLATKSPDELALHQLRRNLFKLGKNQDQALKGMIFNCSMSYFIILFYFIV